MQFWAPLVANHINFPWEESTLSIARIRTAPASAGSAPPRGDSAPVVLSQDRPAWPQWTSKPGGRNKSRKTSENGSVDTPFWEDATSKKKKLSKPQWWFLKKNHWLVFGIFAHSLPGKELWLYSWVLSSPQASKQHETLAKAPWIYQHGTICALGHQHMQRGHFWVQKVLVDVGCTVPDPHKWEIRKKHCMWVNHVIHVSVYTCYTIHLHACTHTHVHAYVHTCICGYMHTCIHAYLDIFMYIISNMSTIQKSPLWERLGSGLNR